MMESLVKSKEFKVKNSFTSLLVTFFLPVFLMTGCSSASYESPESFGARAGEEGAKYFKEQNPGLIADEDSAAGYCATMAEEGKSQNNWTIEETFQAADSCAIWFSTEMFRR
jgi:hypothetical protein